MSKKQKEIFRTWYRSVLRAEPDRVWCESTSLTEVLDQSKGYNVDIYRMVVCWKPISKKKAKKIAKRVDKIRRSSTYGK